MNTNDMILALARAVDELRSRNPDLYSDISPYHEVSEIIRKLEDPRKDGPPDYYAVKQGLDERGESGPLLSGPQQFLQDIAPLDRGRGPVLPELDGARCWPADSSHENGNYLSTCCICNNQFIGHKRRLVCRVCSQKGTRT